MRNYPILEKINSLEDFKALDEKELKPLAEEIRGFVIDSVAKNGGHLASNLGAVELTMALHRVFSSPNDKLIFDVGHQGYVHKLLTGRRNDFDNLRHSGGASGFLKYEESEHDAFNAGHASTSISAAVGILRANKILHKSGYAVAVIGDGALTGGMAFEALNDAGRSRLPLIIVLNDNGMAISGNVGAMNSHLNNIRSSRGYQQLKRSTLKALERTKRGRAFAGKLERLKNRIKYFLLPNNILFETMGFTYLGPVKGHDIAALENMFKRAKLIERPVIIHAITKKGKGYSYAERNPEKFHGIAPFDPCTGELKKKANDNNSKIFGSELVRLARGDDRICAITAAMPAGTGLVTFSRELPSRFFDVGIAEQHAVTMAAGMAVQGACPVVAIYSTFLQRAYDQILHDVCLQKLHVVFAIDRAGLVGEDGETHQGAYDIAYMMHMPYMTIMSPASTKELKQMLAMAVSAQGPVAIRYNRGRLSDEDMGGDAKFGEWALLRPLKHVNLIATGRLVETALKAADGLDAGVVNARFIKPIDEKMFAAVAGASKCIITVEDGIKCSGFGMSIAQRLCGKNTSVINLGIGEIPVSHASLKEQDEQCGLDVNSIRRIIIEELSRYEF